MAWASLLRDRVFRVLSQARRKDLKWGGLVTTASIVDKS